jgi:SAM-dependent methyltransferase
MIRINWHEISKYREQLPSIRRTKRIADYRSFALRYIGRLDSVLDIGCSDGTYLHDYLLPFGHKGKYVGMDIDTDLSVDFPLYQSLDEIPDVFDSVLMFDIVEHEDLSQFLEQLKIISTTLLRPGGKLLISTPNVYSLDNIHTDVTHRTFYPYKDLYSILRFFNFNKISTYRVGKITNLLHTALFYSTLINLDFCGNIFVCAYAPDLRAR